LHLTEPAHQVCEYNRLDVGLPSGTRLGPYEILALLGAGGMGEVYRARDTRLDRTVAIKVVSSHHSSDPVRRQRFERESRAISALQHPNICTVHDVGHQDGADYLVMECLEGKTLALRLAESALPLDQILRYGIEIADALDAAHQRGIVHRDLKPGNIFLTAHGECKVLDFGLAKLAEEQTGSDSLTATRAESLTSPGVVHGTVAYMSPEQVRGDDLDARTDLFSLGTVLYEMATGRRPFTGKTSLTVSKAILDENPSPPSLTNPALPAQLDEIVGKALEKDRDLRYQSAADLRSDLKRLKRDTESQSHFSTARLARGNWRPYRRTNWIAGIVLLMLVVASAGWWWQHKRASGLRFVERQLTFNSIEDPIIAEAISPDGKYVAYFGPAGLRLRVIATGEDHSLPVPGPERRMALAWFPDGSTLLLNSIRQATDTSDGTLWRLSILGGNPTKLREHSVNPSVSPDGTRIAFLANRQQELWSMDAQGENAQMLISENQGFVTEVHWSPDGRYLAYGERNADASEMSIKVRHFDGGSTSTVVSDPRLGRWSAFCWNGDWNIVYQLFTRPDDISEANLWALSVDAATGHAAGAAKPLTYWEARYPYAVSSTQDGRIISTLKVGSQLDVYVGELGNEGAGLDAPYRFTLDDRDDKPDTWTPDSTAVLFESNRSGTLNVYRQAVQGQGIERILGAADTEATEPALTADGKWILYASQPKLKPGTPRPLARLMRAPMAGGSPELVVEQLPDQSYTNNRFRCPRSGATCILTELSDKQLIFYGLDPFRGKGPELARAAVDPTTFFDWNVSADGSKLAVVSALGPFVRIIDLHTRSRRDLPVPASWVLQSVAWSFDGRALFVAVGAEDSFLLARVDLAGQTHILKKTSQYMWMTPIVPSPDGHYLAYGAQTYESNVWLLEKL